MAELSEEQEQAMKLLDRDGAEGLYQLPTFGFPHRIVRVTWWEPLTEQDVAAYRRTLANEEAFGVSSIVGKLRAKRLETNRKRELEDFRVTTIEGLERRGLVVIDRAAGRFQRRIQS